MAEITQNSEEVTERLCNSLAARLSETFSRIAKRRVEVKLLDKKIENYQDYLESLPNFTSIGLFSTELSREQILIEVHPSVTYYLIDILAGGNGDPLSLEGKKMTEIERTVLEKFVFPLIIPAWNEVWEAANGLHFNLSLVRVESDPFLTRRMEGRFLHIVMESVFDRGKGQINICIPARFLESENIKSEKQEPLVAVQPKIKEPVQSNEEIVTEEPVQAEEQSLEDAQSQTEQKDAGQAEEVQFEEPKSEEQKPDQF